jgi:excinuclease ABC subunit A
MRVNRGQEGSEHLDKIINIDQTPIGRTPAPFRHLHRTLRQYRDLFSEIPESKIRGYQKGRFSFNVKVDAVKHVWAKDN